MKDWTLVFYQTASGQRPAQRFVEQLPEPARAVAAALLLALRERGNQLRAPHSKPLGDGLFELRSVPHGIRIFYMFLPGKRIVLLDGVVKKRDEIGTALLARDAAAPAGGAGRRYFRSMKKMKKKRKTTAPADVWLDRLVHHSPQFRTRVEEELAAIHVAQDLVQLRKARGLSQRQLAEQLGVTQSAIAQLESAEPRNLELLTLVRAAAALGGCVRVSIQARPAPRRRTAADARREGAPA